MTFKLFGSKSHHKSHNKRHSHSRHHHHDSSAPRRKSTGNVSERHIDSPRVAARKLLMSIMSECEQGKDDDSFDAPPMECRDTKARNVVAPECTTYRNSSASKSVDTDDDLKPVQLQMGGDSIAGSDAPSVNSSPSGGPPKEIYQKDTAQVSEELEPERTVSPLAKRLSPNKVVTKKVQGMMTQFKTMDDNDDELRESPAEKERKNIYDMEWFAKVEKEMKRIEEKRSCSNLDDDTPTTHDESYNSQSEARESDDILGLDANIPQTPKNRAPRRVKSTDSFSPRNAAIYRQQSFKGALAQTYPDLFEAARIAKPVFEEMMKSIFDHICYGQEDSMISRFADIKDQDRAEEKANGHYLDRRPGPALAWLYDIVRGSVVFSSPDAPMRCIEAFALHPDVHVVNVRNKFESDGLDGYELLNLHLKIDTKKGFQHVCEMQIHHLDVDTLDLLHVDDDRLTDLLQNRLTPAQLERVSYMFSDQLCRYDWAEVVLRNLLIVQLNSAQLGRLGHGSLQVAETYGRLGTILHEHLDRSSEAVEYLEKELEILKAQLGKHHTKVAESYAHIGDVLHAQGETERALEYYGKTVEILQQQQEDNQKQYPWVKDIREDISSLMSTEEEVRESLEMYSKSLDKYKMTVEEGLSNLHDTFESMHKSASEQSLDQVIVKHNESIDECQKTLQEYDPNCADSLGETVKVQGKVDEVFEVYAKSLIQSFQIRKLQKGDGAGPEAEPVKPSLSCD
mmetsp:Transcript_10601/g.25615  ORF Transcript_10601/g.25615 Transcript_10601/m.25615 type:complete len:737 (+) Transcript_10601:81-2291(+)